MQIQRYLQQERYLQHERYLQQDVPHSFWNVVRKIKVGG